MTLTENFLAKYHLVLLGRWDTALVKKDKINLFIFKTKLFFERLFRVTRLVITLGLNRQLTNEQKLRKFFEQASGAFIKFGQILSMRHDLLPTRYTNELLHLLSKVEVLPFSEMEKVFFADFGQPPHDIFLDFNPIPIASASISQVYQAKLKTGTAVVVKIQRPYIKAIFETDFILARFLSYALSLLGLFQTISTKEVVDDFVDWSEKELDFSHEMQNALFFYNHSASSPQTIVPRVYPEYSTERVLVMEYIKPPFSADQMIRSLEANPDYAEVLKRQYNIDTQKLAYYFVKDGLRQFLIDGFFHADPHPANLFFLPNNQLGYFDFGIMGEIGQERLPILHILYGLGQKDLRFVSKNLMAFTKEVIDKEIATFKKHDHVAFNRYAQAISKVEEILIDEIAVELEVTLSPLYKKSTNQTGASNLLKLLIKAEKYNLYLPRHVGIFLRSLVIADMVALKLYPDFDIVEAINQFFLENPLSTVEELIKQSYELKSGPIEDNLAGPIGLTYEELLELKVLEQEELNNTLEHLIDLASFYAEHYEEVRKLLKTNH